MINSHIEIHMELVSKIQSLKEKYEDQILSLQEHIKNYSEIDNPEYQYTLGKLHMREQMIRDLEELLK